jgi:hypothetical protein
MSSILPLVRWRASDALIVSLEKADVIEKQFSTNIVVGCISDEIES